jgi:hypothetical protein
MKKILRYVLFVFLTLATATAVVAGVATHRAHAECSGGQGC